LHRVWYPGMFIVHVQFLPLRRTAPVWHLQKILLRELFRKNGPRVFVL